MLKAASAVLGIQSEFVQNLHPLFGRRFRYLLRVTKGPHEAHALVLGLSAL